MKQVDELIRGELSAVQSIDAILKRLSNDGEVSELRSIREDHVRAVDTLRRFGGNDVDEEVESSGPWGVLASSFTGAASFFGDKAALQALKVGEQHGLNEYQEALRDGDINPELRTVIQSELMPSREQHLSMIDRYIQ